MKTVISLLTVILLGLTPGTSNADECGQPITDGDAPRAVDAMHILRSAIGARQCTLGACDLNSDCEVSVGDALRTLVSSVGGDADRDCDPTCPTDIVCEDAGAPTCNGLCPAGYACTADRVGDVDPDKRVTLCHVPPGNPDNEHTIVVDAESVSAHLRNHPDYLGPCDSDKPECESEEDCAEIQPIAEHDSGDSDSESDSHADSDSDSDSHGDSDSDSDSDSDHEIVCICEPLFVSTTTLPVETTTTTTTSTTSTTVPEPTTTLPPNTTTTTIVDPPDTTTTTTAPPPPDTTTTTTTPPDTTTTTTLAPPDTTTTTIDQGTTTTTTTTTLPLPEDDMDNDGLVDDADPCPEDARNKCFGPVAVDATTETPIRVNANSSGADECSGDRIDCSGDMWFADFGFTGGGGHSECSLNGGEPNCVLSGVVEIFGCEDDATEDLLQCEHFDRPADPELMYSFNVPDGSYLVNLFFANTFEDTSGVGDRVFDIAIEGSVVYPGFDQIVAAGASGRGVVRSAIVNVADGNGLTLGLLRVTQNPAIKAIEVLTEAP